MTAYRVSTPRERVQFSILVTSFQKKTGVTLAKGRIYHIKGIIGNVCPFEKRLFKSPRVVILIPDAYASLILPGVKYDIGIISVEERRRFTVRQHGNRAGLVIRKSALKSMGVSTPQVGREVVELKVRKVSGKDEPTRRIFANVQKSNGFLRFNADGIGARPGDVFEIISSKCCSVRDFVMEFNSREIDEVRNVKLVMSRGEHLGIQVDGRLFPFTEYSLFRLASRLLLRTRLPFYRMELRFWFDGERFVVRFGVDDVAGFQIGNDGKIKFEGPYDEKAVASQRELYSQVQRLRNPILREFARLLGNLSVVSMPSEVAGAYVFEVHSELSRFVCSRLENITRNEYSTRKGDFGEMISSRILSLRYPEVREHPSTKFPKAPGCHKQGVDYEMGSGDSKEVDLLESKWWKNVRAALNQGRIEARRRLAEKRRRSSSAQIRSAFAAALDWDPEMTTGRLIVVQA